MGWTMSPIVQCPVDVRLPPADWGIGSLNWTWECSVLGAVAR